MKILIDVRPGAFIEVDGAFLLPTQNLAAGTDLQVGPALPVSCMFDINFMLVGSQRVGFLFKTRFEVENGGSYLMTYLRNKGPATAYETLVKDENLVVFHYANKGSLAISPLVNPELATVFEEQ
jgi:hypothetical protein